MASAVGMIGLGVMGAVIARRLLRSGHEVRGYNRTTAKAQELAADGLQVARTPREAADGAAVVLSMLTDGAALHSACQGDDGLLAGLRSAAVWVELSTIDPEAARALDAPVRAAGAWLVDGAVLGSTGTLEQGKAVILASGEADAFGAAEGVLRDVAPAVRYLGALGNAKTMKIAANISIATQLMALSEGLVLAERSGIARKDALEAFLAGAFASPMLAYRGPFVLDMPEQPLFDVGMMEKDLRLALDLGNRLNVPLPTTAVSNEMLKATQAMGLGHYDVAVVFYAVARMAGLDVHPEGGRPARE